jgi:hypothetical protein
MKLKEKPALGNQIMLECAGDEGIFILQPELLVFRYFPLLEYPKL